MRDRRVLISPQAVACLQTNMVIISICLCRVSGMSHVGSEAAWKSHGSVTQALTMYAEAADTWQALIICCTMLSGTARNPRFSVPKDSDFLILNGGEQQPEDFLGEGFAVKMGTATNNTPAADWRFMMRSVGGNRDVFFVQNEHQMEATSLDADDVQERYLALQAEFVRYGVHANSPF